MILFQTLLNRNMWANPLSNVMGSWGLYNENGEFTTEAIENFILFIPFTILLLWALGETRWKELGKCRQVLWKAVKIVFLFSLSIEFTQLFSAPGNFPIIRFGLQYIGRSCRRFYILGLCERQK